MSSRSALRAKLKVSGLANGSDSSDPSEPPAAPLPPLPPSASATSSADLAASDDTLAASPDWRMSNFAELERHVSNFLVGKGGDSATECVQRAGAVVQPLQQGRRKPPALCPRKVPLVQL